MIHFSARGYPKSIPQKAAQRSPPDGSLTLAGWVLHNDGSYIMLASTYILQIIIADVLLPQFASVDRHGEHKKRISAKVEEQKIKLR